MYLSTEPEDVNRLLKGEEIDILDKLKSMSHEADEDLTNLSEATCEDEKRSVI
jgi:hypothetical protein